MVDSLLNSKPKPLDCIIKKPVWLTVGDQTADSYKSGVSVVDIIFPGSHSVDVGKLTFKNCYTASITVKLKLRDDMSNETWSTVVKNLKLMPHSHFETGSQDRVTIMIKDIIKPSTQVIMLRLILKQPSPHWCNFGIEEVKCFPLTKKSNTIAPGWMQSVESRNHSVTKTPNNTPNSDSVAASVQQLWALLQQLKSSESDVAIGRFDIDGSYDINLLSYT